MPHSKSPSTSTSTFWQLRTQIIPLGKLPALMGIINVTPDSFSDGGRYFEPNRAVDHAMQLIADGASILDIGGESTRPFSDPVAVADELKRVLPVIERLTNLSTVPISIDTSKPEVAKEAIAAGAEIINDVAGFRNPELIEVAAHSGAGVCAMHMQGTPQTMQLNPTYGDVVTEIKHYLQERQTELAQSGIAAEKICLDPGIGFGKSHEHNLELLRRSREFLELGAPILIGHSRKGFIGKLLGDKELDRDAGTLAISLFLAREGIQILRVHDVARTWQALQVQAGL